MCKQKNYNYIWGPVLSFLIIIATVIIVFYVINPKTQTAVSKVLVLTHEQDSFLKNNPNKLIFIYSEDKKDSIAVDAKHNNYILESKQSSTPTDAAFQALDRSVTWVTIGLSVLGSLIALGLFFAAFFGLNERKNFMEQREKHNNELSTLSEKFEENIKQNETKFVELHKQFQTTIDDYKKELGEVKTEITKSEDALSTLTQNFETLRTEFEDMIADGKTKIKEFEQEKERLVQIPVDKQTGNDKKEIEFIVPDILGKQRSSKNLDFNEAILLGNYFYEKKAFEEALKYYNQATEIDQKNVTAWFNKGVTLDNLERYDEALISYDKAIEINPKYDKAWNNKGNALGSLKRYDEALASYDKAIEINPKYSDAWNNKGNALGSLKRYDEALAYYDKAIEINPKLAEAWYNKGTTLPKLNRYSEAMECFDKAIEINPQDASSWFNKACYYALMNEEDEMLKTLEKAIQLDSKYKEKAPKDEDFKAYWQNERFKKLVE